MSKVAAIVLGVMFLLTNVCFAANAALTRNITFKNQCPFKVWIAFTPSYIPGNNTTCSADKDCLRDAPCIGGQCVYPVPLPQGGSSDSIWGLDAFRLSDPDNPATQSTIQVTLQYSIPDPANPANIVYQYVANFGARTGCESIKNEQDQPQLICETGQCTNDATGACIGGMANPATHAELTLNQASVDYYDLSFVNGVNIPIGISPDNTPAPANPYGQNPLFWCGKSGFREARGTYYQEQVDAQNLLSCNWQFIPPGTPNFNGYDSSVFYTIVNYTSQAQCRSDNDCAPEERCGFSAFDLANTQQAIPLCGKPVAYTVPANVCGSPYNQGSTLAKQAFGCYSEPGALDAFKLQSYYMCALPPNAPAEISAPPTCYVGQDKQPNAECCGCIAWEQKLPLDANSTCRVGDNASTTANFWQSNVRDKVFWLAQNCPAGYTYQFDDVHSTFVCSSVQQPTAKNPNGLNYTVTFCPDRQTLFPSQQPLFTLGDF